MSNILSKIQSPEDVKKLKTKELPFLAAELRDFIIDIVSTKEGHLGASLGVVELTIALHYVFDTPKDKLIWDVGHQAYGHKILTGRQDIFSTNRQKGGISGFPKRSESDYDTFGVGHSSTSISALLGMAIAAKLQQSNRQHIAVIGDASIVSGMVFEALNHAGATDVNMLVILNDNAIGIDPSVGALKEYFSQLSQTESKNNIFSDAFNFHYHGPVDGHDIDLLVNQLSQIKAQKGLHFLHIKTTKGKGLKSAEENQIVYHAPGKFDKKTGLLAQKTATGYSKYQDIFGLTLLELAEKNEQIIGITPAMPTGSSLKYMIEAFPERAFDVGIAEQHAVTLSAGLATEGFIPFCTIYSTFLQRAYDQIIHDVALQNLPVIFCIDRAGLVGADGATHQGAFDMAYLNAIPNMQILVPKDAYELRNTLYTLQLGMENPVAVRYPRGESTVKNWKMPFRKLDFNHVEKCFSGMKIAVCCTGTLIQQVLKAVENMTNNDFSVYHFIQIKPLDKNYITDLVRHYKAIITVEEGSVIGGFGSRISQLVAEEKVNVPVYNLGIPDEFIEHATTDEQLEMCGLDEVSLKNYFHKILNQL
ncbi:MAG TPA: 1-deoxy-D-xylulose-5-phosphate synthase [Flavobacterium sp.]|nr:1-deoxy-D-xylulose-5-phosphate synthase [Flavobacterium sp.]